MAIMQKTTTVKVKVYSEPIIELTEWECPECGQNQKQFYNKGSTEVQCERCGKSFIRTEG